MLCTGKDKQTSNAQSYVKYFKPEKILLFLIDQRLINEPVREKTNNLGFRPGPTQTRLYSHRSRLEA